MREVFLQRTLDRERQERIWQHVRRWVLFLVIMSAGVLAFSDGWGGKDLARLTAKERAAVVSRW